jgi:hypothetical protein
LGEAGWVVSFFYEEAASVVERRAAGELTTDRNAGKPNR